MRRGRSLSHADTQERVSHLFLRSSTFYFFQESNHYTTCKSTIIGVVILVLSSYVSVVSESSKKKILKLNVLFLSRFLRRTSDVDRVEPKSANCLSMCARFLPLFPGDDFSIIQQEIFMVKECTHPNIVAYFGSYLRWEPRRRFLHSVAFPPRPLTFEWNCMDTCDY